MNQACPNSAANWSLVRGLFLNSIACRRRKRADALCAQLEQHRRNQQQAQRANPCNQARRNRGAHDGSQRAADADKSKETLALIRVEDVDQEGPKHGHDKKIEDAGPNKESAAHPNLLRFGDHEKQREKDKQICNQKSISNRNEATTRESSHQGGKQRVRDQHHHQSAGEHPGQILEAAGGAKVISNRANDVIAGKNQKVINEAEEERAQLARFYVDGFAK